MTFDLPLTWLSMRAMYSPITPRASRLTLPREKRPMMIVSIPRCPAGRTPNKTPDNVSAIKRQLINALNTPISDTSLKGKMLKLVIPSRPCVIIFKIEFLDLPPLLLFHT